MRRKDDRLVRPDDGVDVLKENNPRQNGMREPGFLGLMMVFAEVSGGVKKLLGDNRGLDASVCALVEDRLTVHAGIRLLRTDVIDGGACGVETAISALEQPSHVGRDPSVGIALIRGIAILAKQQLVSGIQVDNATIRRKRANALVSR